MKDCLFAMLMEFFEKTLTQIKEIKEVTPDTTSLTSANNHLTSMLLPALPAENNQVLRPRTAKSMRVFTPDEQFKLTKASHQFMVRLMRFELIPHEAIEEIIHQLVFSDSAFVTLQETKWAIRNTLAQRLDAKQLAFLDLVLYQQEDRLALH